MSTILEGRGSHAPGSKDFAVKRKHGPAKTSEAGKENHGPYGRNATKRPKLSGKV